MPNINSNSFPNYAASNNEACMIEVGNKSKVFKVSMKKLYDMLVHSKFLKMNTECHLEVVIIVSSTKEKEHGDRSLQRQISHSASVDLWPFWLEYLELKKFIWCKLNFVGFLTWRPIIITNVSRKRAHMREIWVFKDVTWILLPNRFYEETSRNYVPRHPNWHPSLCFSNLAHLNQKSKLEDFMQNYFFFFGK